jgi:hypothetical protein
MVTPRMLTHLALSVHATRTTGPLRVGATPGANPSRGCVYAARSPALRGRGVLTLYQATTLRRSPMPGVEAPGAGAIAD